MKNLVCLLVVVALSGLSGCAVLRDTMVSPGGAVKVCAAEGGGIIGVAAVAVIQSNCVSKLKSDGYMNVRELGWTGLRFRNGQDGVISARPDANSPAAQANIPSNAEVLAVNNQRPADATEAYRLSFAPIGKTHEIRLKTADGLRTYPLASVATPDADPNKFFTVGGNVFFAKDDALYFHKESLAGKLANVVKRAEPLYPTGRVVVGNASSVELIVQKSLTKDSREFMSEFLRSDIRNTADAIQARGIFGKTTIVESANLGVAPKPSDEPIIYLFAPEAGTQKWQLLLPDGKVSTLLLDQGFEMNKLIADIERLLEKQIALAVH